MRAPGLINKGTNLTQWSRDLEAYLRSITPQPSDTVMVSRTAGGTTYQAKTTQPSTPYTPPRFPFEVITQINPDTEGDSPTYQWGILPTGKVYNSLRPNDQATFSGSNALLTSVTPASDDSGWRDMITTDALWFTGVYGGPYVTELTSLTVNSWGKADSFNLTNGAWSEENGYCENDGGTPPVFQTWRKLVAWSVAGEDGDTPIITQVLKSDQLTRSVAIDGAGAIYPFDHSGGYYTP